MYIFFIYIVYSSPAYFHPFIILKIYFSPIVHIAPSLLLLPPPPHGKGDLALKARLKKKIKFGGNHSTSEFSKICFHNRTSPNSRINQMHCDMSSIEVNDKKVL